MSIGDVTSTERGSGARYNTGKPDLSLVPLTIVAASLSHISVGPVQDAYLAKSLLLLGRFQTTGNVMFLDQALAEVSHGWLDCARVFEYGRAKYAAWNWAKGMSWSAVVACAGRHALKVLAEGEADDTESTLPHVGHYLCNLVMLRTYVDTFPEGNDLPDPTLFRPNL